MAQEDMVRLQQLLKENKKTKTAVKLEIKNEIRSLKLDIASPLNENNPKYYKENWYALVQIAEEKRKKQQQLLQDDEMSEDDDSMDSVSHIPTDTGINNGDSEPAAMDGSNNDDKDQGSYHTKDEMDQEDLSISDITETNEDENEENGSENDGKNVDSDNRLMSSTKEDLLKIVEKEAESKEEEEKEWMEEDEDSDNEESSKEGDWGNKDSDNSLERSNERVHQ